MCVCESLTATKPTSSRDQSRREIKGIITIFIMSLLLCINSANLGRCRWQLLCTHGKCSWEVGARGGGAAGGALRDTVWIEAATMTCKSKLWQPWHKYL